MEKFDRETFLSRSAAQLERLKAELSRLHGEPPCLFAADILTVTGWSDEKRERMLFVQRQTLARAEALAAAADQERAELWQRSHAAEEDRPLPFLLPLKQIREDLEAYESVLKFVRSRRPA